MSEEREGRPRGGPDDGDSAAPPDDAPGPPGHAHGSHGGHGRRRTLGDRWSAFAHSPFLPATVLLLIVSAVAGLFAGSYTYAMANPTPRRIPAAVVRSGQTTDSEERAFVDGMEKALDTSLELHPYATHRDAVRAVDQQKVFTVLRILHHEVEVDLSSASGATVSELIADTAPAVGRKAGVPVTLHDLKPLQRGDPRGLALFYVSLAAVIIGFLGAIQLSVNAKGLAPAARIAFTVGYALLGGFAIAAVVDWLLGALDLPFVESWLILALTMFTSGMVFTMFNALLGRWAVLPTWGVMVLLGNPSSGGAVSWPLLPSLLGHVGRWLPPGASVNAQHTAVYFGDDQIAGPFLVLAGWALASTVVFWFVRDRPPGIGSPEPERAADSPTGTSAAGASAPRAPAAGAPERGRRPAAGADPDEARPDGEGA